MQINAKLNESYVDQFRDDQGRIHRFGDVFDPNPHAIRLAKRKMPMIQYYTSRVKIPPSANITPGEYQNRTACVRVTKNKTHYFLEFRFTYYKDWDKLRDSLWNHETTYLKKAFKENEYAESASQPSFNIREA